MQSKATTVEEYLAELPEDRRLAIETIRNEILKNLPEGFEEGMTYGMIGYYVPHSIYPAGYHCDAKQPVPYVNVASQKNHMAVYLFCTYGDLELKSRFIQEYQESGKKMDMGSSCVRFKKLSDLPVDLIGRAVGWLTVDEFLQRYESMIPEKKRTKS